MAGRVSGLRRHSSLRLCRLVLHQLLALPAAYALRLPHGQKCEVRQMVLTLNKLTPPPRPQVCPACHRRGIEAEDGLWYQGWWCIYCHLGRRSVRGGEPPYRGDRSVRFGEWH